MRNFYTLCNVRAKTINKKDGVNKFEVSDFRSRPIKRKNLSLDSFTIDLEVNSATRKSGFTERFTFTQN